MSQQQRMGPLAEAEGEADRLRQDGPELDLELVDIFIRTMGEGAELRCADCGTAITVSEFTWTGKWDEHREEYGCTRFSLAVDLVYEDQADPEGSS